jgi:hypothetical protein
VHPEGHSEQTEGAHALSPFKSRARDVPERVKSLRELHPNIIEAYAPTPILRNERRLRAGSEKLHRRFVVQSIFALEEGNVLPSDNNVVPHRINADHDENRSHY